MKRAAIILGMALISSLAAAQELPKFPSPCPPKDAQCDLAETGAYIAIGAYWGRLSPTTRVFCIYWQLTHQPASYRDMAACLDRPSERTAELAKTFGGHIGARYWFPGTNGGLPLPNLQECLRLRDFAKVGVCTIH